MAPINEAQLILTCGLPGAGKTTLANELAAGRGAVRLTKDEWQRALGSSPWDRDVGEKIEQELRRLAQRSVLDLDRPPLSWLLAARPSGWVPTSLCLRALLTS